jgi:DNA polymerase-3 subunit delta'
MQFSNFRARTYQNHLTHSADLGRIPHAQLFVGPRGSGTLPMAIAYAHILWQYPGENNGENQACNLKFQKLSHPDFILLTLLFRLKVSNKA